METLEPLPQVQIQRRQTKTLELPVAWEPLRFGLVSLWKRG